MHIFLFADAFRMISDHLRWSLQWIKVRLLGTIPAPLIFGALIDESCILWQESCDKDAGGACLVYDNFYISRYVLTSIKV